MSHSLRAKIKCLRYKGIITDKDCDRLRKALDNENVLDKIRAEILQMPTISLNANDIYKADVLAIIDKYKAESDHKCHNCKHYTSGERDGSCDSYICKNYSGWESEEKG